MTTCGSTAGYQKHRRQKMDACGACKAAWTAARADERGRSYTVYALVDASDRVRYVGVTHRTLAERLQGHISDRRSAGGQKRRWLLAEQAAGRPARIVPLETGVPWGEHLEREASWIDDHLAAGDELFNSNILLPPPTPPAPRAGRPYKRRPRLPANACGTAAGYKRHRRKGEEACPACLQAHAEYCYEARRA